MATKKKSSAVRTSKKKVSPKKKTTKATARKASPKSATNGNGTKSVGIYTVPNGKVSLAVPAFWTLRQTNDDLELEAPSSKTSVIITAFQREKGYKPLDAREYMQHFLETANSNGRPRTENGSKARSVARFRDVDGDNWEVLFLTNGNTLLLATCNSSEPRAGKEAKVGVSVLDSLRLKGSR